MIIDTNHHRTRRIFNVLQLVGTSDDLGRTCFQVVKKGDTILSGKDYLYPDQISRIFNEPNDGVPSEPKAA